MTFQKKPKPPTLLDRLDASAEVLLAGAFGGTTQGTEGPAVESDAPALTDRIKAFEAVVKWMGERSKLAPQEKGNSKGERIRDEFHRRTAGRGANKPDSEGEADDDDRANGSARADA